MLHKIQHTLEAIFLFMTIHWQPLFGILASVAAITYYMAMLKINVVDVKHSGSWKKYLKSLLKRKL